MTARRGHRVVEHTADEIVEAWGPTRAACLEEAVLGFVAQFAAPTTSPRTAVAVVLDGQDDRLLLLDLLDEVLFVAEVREAVPVDVRVLDDGGLVRVRLEVAPIAALTGPAPKGISHSGLDLARQDDRWVARALVDV